MNTYKHRASETGQATSEILLMMPLFILMVGATISIGYMCWQGIKVQQAANFAARVVGQERISGGSSAPSIQEQNGFNSGGDQLPDLSSVTQNPGALKGIKSKPQSGVYKKFYTYVHEMFSSGEQNKLFVPPPVQGINTDRVHVVRVLNPPKILDFKFPTIVLEATAYGGEDSHMYGLPRWGKVKDNNTPFYTTAITGKD